MKSYALHLLGLYDAMFVDIAESRPDLARECERDLSRLRSLVEQRGLPFLMIDLPAFGKHFDKCLSTGLLTPSMLPGFRKYTRRSPIPQLFKGMVYRVFDFSGVLRVNPDVTVIRFLRQLLYAVKKAKVDCGDSRTRRTVREYFKIDGENRAATNSWLPCDFRSDRTRDVHLLDHYDAIGTGGMGGTSSACQRDLFPDLIPTPAFPSISREAVSVTQKVADIVLTSLGIFDPMIWKPRHGPGAVSDLGRTSFKYDFPNWSDSLSEAFPLDVFGFSNYAAWADFASHDSVAFANSEHYSTLLSVPKTLKAPRLIAKEPTSHQWCQQIISDYLMTSLPHCPIGSSVHFHDQNFNRDAALRASHTSEQMTIDLSDASDRLSCWLVERICRANPALLLALMSSRTRWIRNPLEKKLPMYKLQRKFSSMGSACTFPVQTLVFAIIAISAVIFNDGTRPNLANIRKAARGVLVFGDDIIVPTHAGSTLRGLLDYLGLKVNDSKTFDSGKFRESCGMDAYDGVNVSPTYVSVVPSVGHPESVAASVACHNNLLLAGYFRTAAFVRSTVRREIRKLIPYVPIDSGAFGFKAFDTGGNTFLRKRYSADYQRLEYRCFTVLADGRRRVPESESVLLQYFIECADSNDFIDRDRLGVARQPGARLRSSIRWVPAL